MSPKQKEFPCRNGCGKKVHWPDPYIQGSRPLDQYGDEHRCNPETQTGTVKHARTTVNPLPTAECPNCGQVVSKVKIKGIDRLMVHGSQTKMHWCPEHKANKETLDVPEAKHVKSVDLKRTSLGRGQTGKLDIGDRVETIQGAKYDDTSELQIIITSLKRIENYLKAIEEKL